MNKAECVIQATWTSNRQNERHALFVIPNAKGGYELLPFEGGSKLLKGFATITGYRHRVSGGVELEEWDLAFDAKLVQAFEINLDDIIRSTTRGRLAQTMRAQSMQMVQMQTQDGHPLGRLPMNPLLRISDHQIEAVANRILKNTSPKEIALRLVA